ncbi:MAG: heme exporter protein CcmB [Anaerolineales bacterium]|nr:heme exporter protein CcmB [Anaerolineales bacterium]MDW8326631.1 heme exporter protein CcmB [Anaerolineales bacterium]
MTQPRANDSSPISNLQSTVTRGWRFGIGVFFRAVAAILWKDLRAEFRTRELLSTMLVFSLLVVLTFNFALQLDRMARENVAAGVLWVTTIFAGTLGLNRSLAAEKDRGSLDGLLMAPVDRSALYFGKMLGNWLFMLIVQAVVLPVFSLLYNLPLVQPLILLSVLLGTLGYAGVGTLLAALSVQTRARDVMLPILLLPVAVPLLVAAVQAGGGVLARREWSDLSLWFNLLVAYDTIFIAVAYMVFDYVVEE